MTLITFLCIVLFLIGLYFYVKYGGDKDKLSEGLTNNNMKPRCPNMLIQNGSKFFLYNSKLAKVPGVNPIEFNNLEEYTEFLDWQRSQNIRCPVLYLQHTYDTQGNSVYKVRPSVSEPQSGLPPSQPTLSSNQQSVTTSINPPLPPLSLLVDATRDDKPYNHNSYPAYDESSEYIGKYTPLDLMNQKQLEASISPNPMDENWGGANYTQSLVDKGYYKDYEVNIHVP
jgi:hypothetical protein